MRILTATFIVALVFSLLLVALSPIAPVLASASEGRLSVFAGSRLAAGGGVVVSPQGSDVLRWHWCPGNGLAALCVSSAGSSGFVQGIVSAGFTGLRVTDLRFSSVSSATLGLTGQNLRATLSGEFSTLLLPWGESCLPRALVAAEGKIMLADLALAKGKTLELSLLGNGSDGFQLAGTDLKGDFVFNQQQLEGNLSVGSALLPGGQNNGAAWQPMAIAHRLPCQ